MRSKRRLAAVLLGLCLTLCLTGATAAEYAAAGLFAVSYDDSAYVMDTLTYQGDTSDTYRWLFLLSTDDLLIDVGIEALEGYEELSLFSAADEEKRSYLNAFLDGGSVTLLDTIESSGVPFYIFRLQDDEGPYLLAETVVKGYGIDFCAYYDDPTLPADEKLLSALEDVLKTFVPSR